MQGMRIATVALLAACASAVVAGAQEFCASHDVTLQIAESS